MKKKSAIILLLLLAVCTVACGNADNSNGIRYEWK